MKVKKEDLLRNHPANQFKFCPETGLALKENQTDYTYKVWWSDECVWKFHPMTGESVTIGE